MNGAVDLTGYHLSFDAEMTSSADMAYFSTSFNNGDRTIPYNSEAEWYAPYDPSSPSNPFTFQNGELTITATPTPAYGLPYTSGLLTTGQSFYQNQGYFEIRAETPSGAGFWPAFWMLAGGPTDYTTELDILEQPNNDGTNNFYDAVKTPTYNVGAFNNTGLDLSAGYHSYGFMWTATSIQFTFDGQYIGYATATPPALATLKTYLLANLAVGGYGSWPGTPVAGTSAQYKIDYIRAYSNDPSVPVWYGQESISSPDGVDTTPHLSGGSIPTPPVPVPSISSFQPTIVLGSGPDVLALQIAEDAYAGNAQFTVSVDGTQVGGVQTATAIHGSGATQALDVLGSFGAGTHTATVNYLNDAYGGSSATDRNLYVTKASIDNTAIAGSSLTELDPGPQSFTFQGAGSSPDNLTLSVSEDAWQGNAQYTVSVDGKQVGGVYTATASHAAGQVTQQTISGSFGKGAHTVGVTFINDAYGGSVTTDRNLYINAAYYDGTQVTPSTIAEFTNGTAAIAVPASVPNPNILTLHMAEDAYQGDAQFTVMIDGKQVGGTQTVTAPNVTGATQAFSFASVLSAGTHDVAISFLNDLYASPTQDRNLYVAGAELNSSALAAAPWTAALLTTSTTHFSLVVPS